MTPAIITTPGVRGGAACVAGTRITVEYFLARVSANGLDRAADELEIDQALAVRAMNEVIGHYQQPPGPSIEAAAKEIARLSYKFWRNVTAGESAVPEIRDILTRHFGQASRAPKCLDCGAWELETLQSQVAEWSTRNFGGRHGTGYRPLLGVFEELGELAHAHLKAEQGIRTNEDHEAAKIDAVGDVVIYLVDYCNGQGIDFAKAVQTTWELVRKRDWQANKESGETLAAGEKGKQI